MIADVTVKGKPRKGLIQANRNGFFYVLDRASGKLLAANQYARRSTGPTKIDMKTGRPIDTPMTEAISRPRR